MVVTGIISLLITIGLIVVIIVLFISKYLEVHEIVEEAALERHALNLGHAILSYEKLVYNDGSRAHRGVFEIDKIEAQIAEGSDMTTHFGYPNSVAIVGVKEFDSPYREWATRVKGPVDPAATEIYGYVNCLWSKLDVDLTIIFNILGSQSLWDQFEEQECAQSYSSSTYGTTTKIFPIGIKEGGSVHLGALYVIMGGAWTSEEIESIGGGE
jgi:hypothetical protein